MPSPVYPRQIAKIQGQSIVTPRLNVAVFRGDLDIDADGSGPNEFIDSNGRVWRDRYYQPDTTYHFKGKALNAHKIPYVVVPMAVVIGLPGIVFGSLCIVRNRKNGRVVECVVADLGPAAKVGEVSIEAARRLGVNPNPVIGGDDDFEFEYEVHAGVPAVIDGITYALQAYRTAKAA